MAEINEGVKIWVKQVRRLANKIEDVFDEYTMHLANRSPRQDRGFINFIRKVTCFIIKVKPRHQIASQIQDIKVSIYEIKERAGRYQFSSIEQGSSSSSTNWLDPRIASLFIEDDEVVGIESPRDELISKLVREELNESKRAVISLVGMGGLGKTTLAKKVYDNKIVIARFDCRAWIPVSQSFKKEDLLNKMIKQFHESCNEILPEGIDTMEEILLISKLREYLELKRYVVVLDDVWDIELWQYIKSSLPNKNNGSRIIITTRNEDVASSCLESPLDHVHRVQPLPQDKAWELFCKKTFHEGHCPPVLVNCSLNILKCCEGLPLAIVAVGGLLSTKNKVLSTWQMFYHNLGSELGRNSHFTSVSKIILFSYHDLPHYLKSCFLYMGTIRKGYVMDNENLIRLWIAEGFVRGQMGKTLEEIGKEYLLELIHRSLFQATNSVVNEYVAHYRVHDLVREIIILKSEELSFYRLLTQENTSFEGEARRLIVHVDVGCSWDTNIISPIRSIRFIGDDNHISTSSLRRLIECFKLLKVLHLQSTSIDELPEEVGNLIHLRYLSVSGTKIKFIPKSISKLHNLLTLNLTNSLVHELPIEFCRLKKLRHLFCFCLDSHEFSGIRGMKIQEGIGGLKELQELFFLEENHNGIDHIKELENLRNLRQLGITKLRRESGRALCASIGNMEHIKRLDIWSTSEDEILDLQSLSSPPQTLERIRLIGRLEKLPDWIPKLQNLTFLHLLLSGLEDDPIKALQTMHSLQFLILRRAYSGERLYFEAHGFKKLTILVLKNLEVLNLLTIEEGALPLLENVVIESCPQLKEVPSGIYNLKKLLSVEVSDMPEEFSDRIVSNKDKQGNWIVDNMPVKKSPAPSLSSQLSRYIPTL